MTDRRRLAATAALLTFGAALALSGCASKPKPSADPFSVRQPPPPEAPIGNDPNDPNGGAN